MYEFSIDKDINNNRCVFSSMFNNKNENKSKGIITDKRFDRFTIEQKIFNIFNAKDYIYKADVNIVTDNGILNKRIVGKNANNLITMDNEYIPISDIKDIYKK